MKDGAGTSGALSPFKPNAVPGQNDSSLNCRSSEQKRVVAGHLLEVELTRQCWWI